LLVKKLSTIKHFFNTQETYIEVRGIETFLRPVGADRLRRVNRQDAGLAKKADWKPEAGC